MQSPHALTLTFAPQRVQFKADATGGKPEAGAPVRFTGVAYSGGIVPSYGWRGDVAIDLSTLQNAQGSELPVLVDHDTRIEALCGKGRIRTLTDASGVTSLAIDGELTTSTESGKQIAALMAEGYPLQMSVGMSANVREVTAPIMVNGQQINVKAVFEQPLIREVSFVAVGADPQTRAAQTLSVQPITHRKDASMSRSAEDQTLIDGLTADVQRLSTTVTELQAAASSAAAQRRSADLSALFADLGQDVPQGDAAKPYMDMTEASFAAMATTLRATRAGTKKADETLFSSQATQRAGQQKAPAGAGESLLAAVQTLSAQRQINV